MTVPLHRCFEVSPVRDEYATIRPQSEHLMRGRDTVSGSSSATNQSRIRFRTPTAVSPVSSRHDARAPSYGRAHRVTRNCWGLSDPRPAIGETLHARDQRQEADPANTHTRGIRTAGRNGRPAPKPDRRRLFGPYAGPAAFVIARARASLVSGSSITCIPSKDKYALSRSVVPPLADVCVMVRRVSQTAQA